MNMSHGDIIVGIGNALYGEITFKNDVPDKMILRQKKMIPQDDTPRSVEIYFVRNEEEPTGLGEPLCPPVSGAVTHKTAGNILRSVIRESD